ncbi:MAG TPA: hypothetical protein ENG81_00870 [Candidatus Bathyarchaeota archaeon]|nr:MAG: hypothetical protein DRJ30_05705 [Candidatus Verstraetearchaeota archaeon]HDO20064.1 hypothetical protein [Candidatus Bathyarchaeota archaeon]
MLESNIKVEMLNQILRGGDEESLLMGDIIRVLSLGFGRLWLSELILELKGFRLSLNEKVELEERKISKAVEKLEKMNIVKVESRLKSRLNASSMPDKLISLNDYRRILENLKNDQRYNEYVKLRDEIFGKH